MIFKLKKMLALTLVAFFALTLQAQEMTLDYALQNEKWDEATKQLEALTQKDANDANAMLKLANVYVAQGMTDKAKAICEKVAAGSNKNMTYVAAGRLAFLNGDMATAATSLAKAARKCRGKDANIMRSIGETYSYGEKRDLDKAETLLKEAYSKHSKKTTTS